MDGTYSDVFPIRDNEVGGGKEVREFKEVRDVKEPESLPKARKPLLKFPKFLKFP
jgi:hypothetical protein